MRHHPCSRSRFLAPAGLAGSPLARVALAALAGVVLLGAPAAAATPAAEVLEWNVTGFAVTADAGMNPILQSRALAMTHLAVHDALNAIERRYEPYLHEGRGEAGASPTAAVAAAAREVLAGLVARSGSAEQRARAAEKLEAAYAAALARVPAGAARDHGLTTGQAAARAMLAARAQDGAAAPPTYTPGTAPGHWRPTPNPVPANPPIPDPALAPGNWPAMLPQWKSVAPFTMATPWQFRLPGPPRLDGAQWARDYDEVKRLGGKASAERSAAQAEIAAYWYEPSPQGWSRIARVVAAQRGLDAWDSARLLALVNAVIADGFIAGADTRYLYNFWRPVTAIRGGDTDGNDATVADPRWESFMNTPAMPDYPSTHSVAGGAASVVLARVLGSDQVAFSMASGPPFAGITRSFASFSQAAAENAESRILAGLHFRSACRDGVRLGQQIGRRAVAQHLRPYQP
jgi:hypothetical protein